MSILTVLFIILVGTYVFVERRRSPNDGFGGAFKRVLASVWNELKGLTETPKQRYGFDDLFWYGLRNIVEPYAAVGMDIEIYPMMDNGLPYILVQFVPENRLTDQEIGILTERLKIKFRKYLAARCVCWRIFTEYTQCSNNVQIRLNYAEYPEDLQPLTRRYQLALKDRSSSEYGCLRDEDLDRELQNAGKTRIPS